MKDCSPELTAFLATTDADKLIQKDLFTITLTNGIILYYTSADKNITYNSNTYISTNMEKGDISETIGLSVDNLPIDMYPKDTDFIGDIQFAEACRNGTFDGVYLQLDYAYYTEGWDNEPLVLEERFVGKLDICDNDGIGKNHVKFEVKAPTEDLTIKLPQNVCQTSCPYTLYGAGCNVDKSICSENSSVSANTTQKIINCGLIKPNGYYQNGVILFTSGKNINIKRGIKYHTNGVLTLNLPLLYAPSVGDTFTVSAGCDKTMATCKNKFNNLANFGGTPFIPNPDSTLS